MFAWVIVAYLQNLGAHLRFEGYFYGPNLLKVTFELKILLVGSKSTGYVYCKCWKRLFITCL